MESRIPTDRATKTGKPSAAPKGKTAEQLIQEGLTRTPTPFPWKWAIIVGIIAVVAIIAIIAVMTLGKGDTTPASSDTNNPSTGSGQSQPSTGQNTGTGNTGAVTGSGAVPGQGTNNQPPVNTGAGQAQAGWQAIAPVPANMDAGDYYRTTPIGPQWVVLTFGDAGLYEALQNDSGDYRTLFSSDAAYNQWKTAMKPKALAFTRSHDPQAQYIAGDVRGEDFVVTAWKRVSQNEVVLQATFNLAVHNPVIDKEAPVRAEVTSVPNPKRDGSWLISSFMLLD